MPRDLTVAADFIRPAIISNEEWAGPIQSAATIHAAWWQARISRQQEIRRLDRREGHSATSMTHVAALRG
jgi:hypothetical protein